MKGLAQVAWSCEHAAEALTALARAAQLPLARLRAPLAPGDLAATPERLARWLELCAHWYGLELEPVVVEYGALDRLSNAAGPALLRLPDAPAERCLVALCSARGRWLRVVAPDSSVQRIPRAALTAALAVPLERQAAPEIEALLKAAAIRAARRPAVRRALLRARLASHSISGAWLLRAPPGASFRAQLARLRAARRVLGLGLAHAGMYALSIAAWWLVGAAALDGRVGGGWLLAWALLLFTQLPLALLMSAARAALAIDIALLLKQRLLAGALKLAPEQVRSQGAGELLGRVLESEAVEALAQGPGYVCLLSVIELAAALVVLALGASARLEVALLLAWIAGATWLGIRYYRGRRVWTEARLDLTQALVERMQGHRTRLAQCARPRWHEGEDDALADYLACSARLDARASALGGLVPGGWLVIGVSAWAAAIVVGTASPGALATTLGGVLLAARALHRLALGAASLAGAAIAWREIAPLFHAAANPEPRVAPEWALDAGAREVAADAAHNVLEARELVFRYRQAGAPVLRGCSLEIRAGDRLLLEGASGGGKSTFASLLAGVRRPEAGVLLTRGLDLETWGPREWRRHVVAAPQFHENHVLSAPLAFNLLLGRAWPPSAADYRAAEDICRELQLDSVISRMPCGLQQLVGETGWQLSHGEKSRLYIARALLQDADVLLFDESFGALDPDTLERTLHAVLRRARSLVVIAHP